LDTFRANSETVACTLTPDDLKEAQAGWEKLLSGSLISRKEIPGGLKLVVHPGSEEALRKLVDIERECCRWITFQLDGPTVEMTAPVTGESAIREMWA
jgi:hypothetical protein